MSRVEFSQSVVRLVPVISQFTMSLLLFVVSDKPSTPVLVTFLLLETEHHDRDKLYSKRLFVYTVLVGKSIS